jgi:hypothetical protein
VSQMPRSALTQVRAAVFLDGVLRPVAVWCLQVAEVWALSYVLALSRALNCWLVLRLRQRLLALIVTVMPCAAAQLCGHSRITMVHGRSRGRQHC